MNKKKISLLILAAMISVSLTSCSIFKSKDSNSTASNDKKITATEPSTDSKPNASTEQNNNSPAADQANSSDNSTTSEAANNTPSTDTKNTGTTETKNTSSSTGSKNTGLGGNNNSKNSNTTATSPGKPTNSSNSSDKGGGAGNSNSTGDTTATGDSGSPSNNGGSAAPGDSANSGSGAVDTGNSTHNNDGGTTPGNSANSGSTGDTTAPGDSGSPSNNGGSAAPGDSGGTSNSGSGAVDTGNSTHNNDGGTTPGNSANSGSTGDTATPGDSGSPSNNGGSAAPGDSGSIIDETQWKLIWSDEFNGAALDTNKWTYDIGNAIVDANGNKITDGWGNNEKEYYTNSTNNVFLDNGLLNIKANREKVTDQFGTTLDYTSGKIKTLGKFSKKYGRIDVRAKLPQGKGLWPAIWMLPEKEAYGGWAASGEIDIMEAWGSKPDVVAGTIHYGSVWPNNTYTGKQYTFPQGESINTAFHVYSLEWEPGEIRWYVDGNLYQTQNNWFTKDANNQEKYSFPAPFDQNFYIILNLAVGGNWDGEPDAATQFSQPLQVDYVRVYDLIGRPYKTPVEPMLEVDPLPENSKPATQDGNYIYNGNFNTNDIQDNPDGSKTFGTDWNFVHIPDTQGNGNVSIDTIDGTNYAKVDITSAGTKDYAVQLIQTVTLGKGRWYKISFDSKTDTNRQINIKMSGDATKGWTTYSEVFTAALTKDIKHFEYTFQMEKDTDIAARLEFELGLNTSPLWIGNVRLEEISVPSVDYNTSKTPLADGNHIYNGAFDKVTIDRMAYWNFTVNGANASAQVLEATRELSLNILEGGASPEAIMLNQKGIQLSKGEGYKLTFKAKASLPRTIQVGILNKDGSISYMADSTINLTTSMNSYSLDFTMDQPTDNEAQLVFKLGGNNATVYMDDVSLVQTTNAIDYSDVDIYPLKNGDFSKDLTFWAPYPNIGDGADSVISSENQQAKIAINKIGPNPWSIMLNQENFKISKGVVYKVAFDVRATATRNMEVVIENAAYSRSLSKTVEAAAGNDMKHYEFTFTADKDDLVSLKFLMGKTDAAVPASSHIIYLDNVVCEVKDAPFKKSPELVSSTTNNELNKAIDITFVEDEAWRREIKAIKINDTTLSSDKYTVSPGKLTLSADNFSAAGNYVIKVIATGYADSSCTQTIKAPQIPGGNLITNGTFESSMEGWKIYTGDGSNAIPASTDGALKVNFPDYAGWFKWSTQIYQDTIALEAGKTYILKFDASSTLERDAWLEMTGLEPQTLHLTPDTQTFTYQFTSTATLTNGKLNFLLGTNNLKGEDFVKNQSVIIDNVSITEKSEEQSEEGTVTPAPATDNLIINGDFSSDTIAPWTSWSDGGLSVTSENGEAKIDVNGFGGDPWSVQFSQNGLRLTPNVHYTLSFKAKGSIARTFGVDIEGAGYFRYFDQTDELTTDMQTYTYDILVTKDELTKLNFFFGKTGNDVDPTVPFIVNIDDVSITER